ncbi:MAG: NfeD family protein [Planctomycetota bacterium]
MSETTFWITAVFSTGLVAMIIELFIPGAVVGISGFLMSVGSIAYAYYTGHIILACILMAGLILFVPIFFIFWKNVVGNVLSLEESEKDYRSSLDDYESLRGATGQATISLRPSGTATINDRRYAVVTRGEMIDKGRTVKVIDVTGSRLTVTEIHDEE